MTVYTLFGQPSAPATLAADATGYTMGMQFSLSSDAALTGVWFYSDTGAGQLPRYVGIKKVSDGSTVALSALNPSWSGAAGSGWVKVTFDGSVTLLSGVAYKVGVTAQDGSNWYSITAHYWDSGSGASGLTNGIITAPNDSGADAGQGSYIVGDTFQYPNLSFNASNYWVDVEVTTTAITGDVAATLPSLTADVVGTVTAPGTGDVAATLPSLTAAVVATVLPPPVTGTVDASLPSLTATLSDSWPAPASRTYTVPAASRTYTVPAASRTYTVP